MRHLMNYQFLVTVLLLTAVGLGLGNLFRQQPLAEIHLSAPVVIPEGAQSVVLGMGCFWGAEKRMAALPGVVDVVSGYAGGEYPDPSYRRLIAAEHLDVRNHAEVVKVTFDPKQTSLEQVLVGFWESHNPTQGDRQGNDVGSTYRSAVYYNSAMQRELALMSRDAYQIALDKAGHGAITTEIAELDRFYPAEEYHQDYLQKNPNGYCGLGGIGVHFPGRGGDEHKTVQAAPLDAALLSEDKQLIVFESQSCPFCKLFKDQVMGNWMSELPIATSLSPMAPKGWVLEHPLWATPTVVLFKQGQEVSRYTGYNGEEYKFWSWLNESL